MPHGLSAVDHMLRFYFKNDSVCGSIRFRDIVDAVHMFTKTTM